MFSLVVGFSMQMRKRVATAQEGNIPGLEVSGDKRSKSSRYHEEVQADLAMIFVDVPE